MWKQNFMVGNWHFGSSVVCCSAAIMAFWDSMWAFENEAVEDVNLNVCSNFGGGEAIYGFEYFCDFLLLPF